MSLLTDTTIRFVVYGVAQPAGSKRSLPLRKKGGGFLCRENGSPIINTVDANPKAGEWKKVVAQEARRHYSGELLTGPIRLRLTFVRVRPKGHFGSGKNAAIVKSSAPGWPTARPDLLKLARGVEDSLTGVVWQDDAQIVEEILEKRWGEPACVVIVIEPVTEQSNGSPDLN